MTAKQTVDLAFQTAGQIVKFPAIEGRIVPAGDMIAQLDLEPFKLSLEQARLQWDRARRRAERLKKLEGKTVSQVSVEDATTEAGLAKIALRNAEYSLKHATLHAPFDALVARRSVARFTTVNAGTPVARLHDMSEIRIEIEVPEVLFQRAGRDPDVTIAARFPAGKTLFPVEVREFNAETSRIGQTFRVTLGMAPPEGLNILPRLLRHDSGDPAAPTFEDCPPSVCRGRCRRRLDLGDGLSRGSGRRGRCRGEAGKARGR